MKIWKLILLITLFGLTLRLVNLHNYMFQNIGYDQARDVLVAQHFLKYDERIERGPEAFGAIGLLTNSVGYYYLITVLLFFSQNPENMMFILATIFSLMMLIAFVVGKNILDKETGLIFSLLLAFSPELIAQSKNLYQPHFLPLFSLVFLLSATYKKIPWKLRLIVMISSLLIPLHLHFGAMLLLPFGIAWIGRLVWIKYKSDRKLNDVFLACTLFLFLLTQLVIATYTVLPFDQLSFISSQAKDFLLTNMFTKILEIVNLFLLLVFSDKNAVLEIIFKNSTFQKIFIGILVSPIFFVKSSLFKNNGEIVFWITGLLYSGFFAIISSSQLHHTYFSSLIPIFYLILALFLRFILKINKIFGLALVGIILIFSFYVILLNEKSVVSMYPIVDQLENISDKIVLDIKENRGENEKFEENFTIALMATDDTFTHDGWGTTPIWYFLEQKLNTKLISITDDRHLANIVPNVKSVETIYFVCEDRSGITVERSKKCLDKFYFERSNILNSPKLLTQTSSYILWKIETMYLISGDLYRSYEFGFVYPSYDY